jgi:hypothetical protein
MKVTYLDLKTGKTAQETGISEFQLTENNWSCDCNRCRAFGLREGGSYCLSQRFIVISVEAESKDELFDDEDVIARANSDYYRNILAGDNENGLEADWVKIDGGEK